MRGFGSKYKRKKLSSNEFSEPQTYNPTECFSYAITFQIQ